MTDRFKKNHKLSIATVEVGTRLKVCYVGAYVLQTIREVESDDLPLGSWARHCTQFYRALLHLRRAILMIFLLPKKRVELIIEPRFLNNY